jgi:hypothetical protein
MKLSEAIALAALLDGELEELHDLAVGQRYEVPHVLHIRSHGRRYAVHLVIEREPDPA